MKLGIVGCGAIGSEIAYAVSKSQISGYTLAGLHDIDKIKVQQLLSKIDTNTAYLELDPLIQASDIILEATTKFFMPIVMKKTLDAGKSILVMSVGGIADRPDLLDYAEEQGGHLYFPSGAICGIDGILAAREAGLKHIQITSTKHPKSLVGSPYLARNNISIENLPSPKLIFEGNAMDAINEFPANVNVSITLSLAGLGVERTHVRIIADPNCQRTRHEIIAEGNFGTVKTITEGIVAPDNPRTSYLAILSAKATLRKIHNRVHVGT